MHQARDFLVGSWLSLALLAAAVGLGAAFAVRWRRRHTLALPLALAGAACGLLALGGLALPTGWGLWLGAAALTVLFGMLLALIISGWWSVLLACAVAAVLLLSLGGTCAEAVQEGLADAARAVVSLEPTQPWWLLLIGLVPVLVAWSYRSLAGLGPVRRWLALGLRSALIILLALALAEVRLRHQNENITTLFLVDRSLSIPEEYDAEASPDANRIDHRSERVERFINEAVRLRGPEHKFDRAGLILFGRRPRLELPPSNAPSFNFHFRDAASPIDGNYTDIAAAIKLALASFPEGTGKRIVLVSDGNENLGNAEEQARIAKLNGVQIDVVPLAAGYRNENEVLVERVEAPPRTEQGSRLPIRVLVRSYHPRTVYGTLVLKQITEGESAIVPPSPAKVQLRPGLNAFSFQQPLVNQQQSYTYQAIFQPEAAQNERGQLEPGLAGDRVQNNSATTHVVALGQRRILLVEPNAGEHQLLADRLRAMGNSKYKLLTIPAARLPENKAELGVFLSNYDCVILANVPAELLNEEQQEMLRSNTHDQGCGLIMIGGPDAFGAGGWQGTPVEKALPVDCDIKSFKVQGKGGLVLIMHASEMSDGNRWQKEIAKLAIKKLSPMDEVGILHYDWGAHKWHIPLQVIGSKRNALLAQVDRMVPGDMPDFDGPLKMAHASLTEARRQLATKHVIVISDGDPQNQDRQLLSRMKRDKVTVTTVGVATHGASQDQALKSISDATGGRFYKVTNARALPAIYIKETRIVSQSFLYERMFQPRLVFKSGPTDNLPSTLNPLYGFVRTTPKQSPLVELPILGPPGPDIDFPILAHWHYGLGKALAFTSDARSLPGKPGWDRDWAGSDMYSKFWEQVVDYALRPTETGRLVMTTEYHDGRVKVTVDARDNNRPMTDLMLQGGVTSPSPRPEDARRFDLKFEQKNSGLYEAEFKAEEAGSYFISAQARRSTKVVENGKEVTKEEADSVRSGVTIPYSPEFADLESNTALLERLRDMTGGKSLAEDLLEKAARANDSAVAADLAANVFRSGLPQFKNLQPVWFWLIFATGLLLFFDVAIRRIAVQPAEVSAAAERVWSRLRGRPSQTAQTPQFIDRLQSRKAQVSEALDQLRAARRFEPVAQGAAAPAGADEAVAGVQAPAPRPVAAPRAAPPSPEEAADYASRLLKAKQRVWEQREKEKSE
jgi:uncharacterized membrane protein